MTNLIPWLRSFCPWITENCPARSISSICLIGIYSYLYYIKYCPDPLNSCRVTGLQLLKQNVSLVWTARFSLYLTNSHELLVEYNLSNMYPHNGLHFNKYWDRYELCRYCSWTARKRYVSINTRSIVWNRWKSMIFCA